MKVDLHTHFKRRAKLQEDNHVAMIARAYSLGFSALAFTEHHQMLDADTSDAPIRVYRGVEISCGNDVLVYDLPPEQMKKLNRPMTYSELWQFVKWHGGTVCLAHPFRRGKPLAIDVHRWRPDAIELSSRNTPTERQSDIVALATRLGVPTVVASDAHKPRHLGHYFIEVPLLPETVGQMYAMLKAQQERVKA